MPLENMAEKGFSLTTTVHHIQQGEYCSFFPPH